MSSDIERIISLFQQEFIFYGLEPVKLLSWSIRGRKLSWSVIRSSIRRVPGRLLLPDLARESARHPLAQQSGGIVGALGPGWIFWRTSFLA